MTTTAEAVRAHRGPALFSYGFRPFFMFSAVWAAVAVAIWIAALLVGDGTVAGMDGLAWHKHEMLFGYLPGVIAGFLLTATPNWTGRLPITGWPLALLFGLWAAGRTAGVLPDLPDVVRGVVQAAFPLVFAGVVWREVLAGRNLKNVPICVMLTLLAGAEVAFHLARVVPSLGTAPERAALAVGAGLIALIGGRIIPSFTRNWTAAHGIPRGPAPFGRLDAAALAAAAAGLTAWTAAPDVALAGGLLCLAGVLALVRLSRWRGWRTGPEPLVWILHLGYAWLGIGLLLIGGSVLAPGLVPRTAGIHALTAGAIGVMILAVMTRASLGHTGRPRVADRATLAVYLAVNAAAVLRVAAPFAGEAQLPLLAGSATLWCAAYGGFALAYGPMLCRPRVGA